MKKLHDEGGFDLITGPMFSGKTTTLIKRRNELVAEGYNTRCFKPSLDNRYDSNHIVTHEGQKIKAHVVERSEEILKITDYKEVVFIDEIQFFNSSILNTIVELRKRKVQIIGAGLEYDYMGNHFGEMKALSELATSLSRLTGECNLCHGIGTRTYRKNKNNLDTVLVGSNDIYELRCESCYHLEQ